MSNHPNIDEKTVKSFGEEWSRFDQSALSDCELIKVFNEYFSIFPWAALPLDAEGFDMGCGSGRWAKFVAPRVGRLHCIDPSESLLVAKTNLSEFGNVEFHRASVGNPPLKECSQDFGYSLGVLHHVPNTADAIKSCVSLLKPGAPFLIYLYYAFDNRPMIFRFIWRLSDLLRRVIIRLPSFSKNLATDLIALSVYYPLAKTSFFLSYFGVNTKNIPLSYYKDHSLYTMRTDSRDRFGTPLEHRFSQGQIISMMKEAGLSNIEFSSSAPFWCAIGYKN